MAVHIEFVIDKMAKGQVHLQASCFCHADSFEPAVASDSLSVRSRKHLLECLFVNKLCYLQENCMIMNGNLERMLKEVIMLNLKIPSQHLTAGTENYHKNPLSK